jgi:hypothetical protein
LLILLISSTVLLSVNWKSWRYGDIRVTSAPKDTAYANLMVKSLHQKINAFQVKLGVYPINPLQIIILPNRQEYRNLTQGKGKIVESSEAFYSPVEHKIYVRSPDQITTEVYDNVLMHEYIHWFLDETLDNVPLWFHEGMAMYYSGQFNFQAYYSFTRYRFMGYKLSLNDMVYQYPADKSYWEMFYLTSVFAINNLEGRHNKEWQDFWNIVGMVYNSSNNKQTMKSDFIKVFNYAFKMSLYAYSKQYDKTLSRYGWQFPLVGINAFIFALLPFVVIFGWLKGRRRMKAMPDSHSSEPEKHVRKHVTKSQRRPSHKHRKLKKKLIKNWKDKI